MLAQQDGRCAICREQHEHLLHVDHCHKSGRTRALLCRGCNNGLAGFNDNIERMQTAIGYIMHHAGKSRDVT